MLVTFDIHPGLGFAILVFAAIVVWYRVRGKDGE